MADWIDHKFPVIGTEVSLRFFLEDAHKAELAKQAVVKEMHRIDATMSPFKKESLLSKINDVAAAQPVKISEELLRLIKYSLSISKMTKGSFDITFSSVGYLYDYRLNKKPSEKELAEKLPLINYQSIVLNEQKLTIFYKHPGVKIDLGGIAKGLAVDNSISILRSFGVTEASVTAGGDTFADVLSTRVFVLGVEKGMALVESLPNISAIIVDGHGKMFYSFDLSQLN